MSPKKLSAALGVFLLLPLVCNAAESARPPVRLPPMTVPSTTPVPLVVEYEGDRPDLPPVDGPETEALGTPGGPKPGPPAAATDASRLPGTSAPGTRIGGLRPRTPLKGAEMPATGTQNSTATPVSRSITVSDDGASVLTLSSTALNRLLFADQIVSAYTATEAVDIILDSRTAIVTFRASRPADVMFVTQGGQYLLRLVPENLSAQTVRIRLPKPEAHVTSSYQTYLADLIQAGYRRKPPEGYRTEQPNRPHPMPGALAWYLTLQHRGHRVTIQEYAVANTGAMAHKADPVTIAHLFPNARAISSDPEVLQPGAWARVFVVVDTETIEPPEPSK